MAIGSTLTKGMRKTVGENNNPQKLRKGSNIQGDSDNSEGTSFSSSAHGSTTSSGTTSSTSSGIEGGKDQRKTLDHKVNSHKVTAASGSSMIRPSRRRPQSRLMDGPVEPSPDLQKPAPKFTRSGSMRSLRILRKKNMPSSEPNKSSNDKDLHSKKATFSSILKDSKFHNKQVDPQMGVKESDEEVLSTPKLCSYEHCSLHGNHHHHEPPLKRFSFLKRRSSKDQKTTNPQIRPTDKRPIKKKEVKVTQKPSNVKEKDVDYSIEFYAKTRPEPSIEPNYSQDNLHLADIMFGINGNNNGNQMSMWRLIHRHMVSGTIEQQLQEEDDDVANKEKEIQKMFAVKIVREAIEKILLPEEDISETNQEDDQTEPNQAANDLLGPKNDKQKGWNYVKKVVLMRRFITELEKAKRKLEPDKREHVLLAPEQEPEAESVSLRSQTSGDQKKNSNEWMLDYALQQVVSELAPTQKRKVALLVKSFEMISPKLEKGVAI